MAISFVDTEGASSATTIDMDLLTYSEDDLLIGGAARGNASGTGTPTGWGTITTAIDNTGLEGYLQANNKIAVATESDPVWSSAARVLVASYRGHDATDPIGAFDSNGNSTTVPGLTLEVTDGSSWVVVLMSSSDSSSVSISGMTQRLLITDAFTLFDTNGGVSSFAGGTITGMGGDRQVIAVFEVKAAAGGGTTHERSAAIAGTGAIATSGEFFSVFERTAALASTGLVATAGQRDLLRQAAISGTGLIATTGQRDLLRQVSLDATGLVAVAGEIEGAHERQVAISGTGAIQVAGEFFSILERAVSLDAVGAVITSGEVEGGAATHTRAASLDGTGTIQVVGQRELLRAVSLAGVGSIEVTRLTPEAGGHRGDIKIASRGRHRDIHNRAGSRDVRG